jgi:formylglycine-generating enzyme required for sulfatase activity
MDKYEVTNAQYRQFVQATGYKEPEGWAYINGVWNYGYKPWSDNNLNGDNQPVTCVSWEDAKAYCEWAGKRVPTEAEWEKAARGGLVGKRYVWGDSLPSSGGAGNFADETAKKTFHHLTIFEDYDDGYVYTSPVGSFEKNGYGLYDMAGNVWEWCADWYDSSYYATSPTENPRGPGSGTSHVLRGGSWSHNPYYLRVAFRFPGVQGGLSNLYSSNLFGFRCAQDAKPLRHDG